MCFRVGVDVRHLCSRTARHHSHCEQSVSDMHFFSPIFLSSLCFYIAGTSQATNDLNEEPTSSTETSRGFPIESGLLEKMSPRQIRSFFKKLGFLSGIKVGSSFPSQSSGQLIATHNGNFLGKFLNANVRLIYGSNPLLTGGVGAVIPPVTTVASGPLKGGQPHDASTTSLNPGFIFIPLRRDPSVADKNQTDDKLSVESILIPVYEKVGAIKIPEAPATERPTTTTTERPLSDNATNVENPPTSNETSTDTFFIL